jgi:ATP-dependent protease HslVU (ClpYQ) peptidase subunit
MTTLAAVQGKGWCVIGADAQFVDDSRSYVTPKASGKIFKTKGYIVAVCGELRPLQIIQHHMVFSEPTKTEPAELDKFMAIDFIPSLREALKSEEYTWDKETSWTLMVAVKGMVYLIDQDLTWTRDERGLYGEGTGGDVALGVMAGAKFPISVAAAKLLVQKAISKASDYDVNTKPPISLYVQDSK